MLDVCWTHLGERRTFRELEPAVPLGMAMRIRFEADVIRAPCKRVAWHVLKRALDLANLVIEACPRAVLDRLHFVTKPPFHGHAVVLCSLLCRSERS